jgi:precorrin-6B methylase 2
MKGRQMSASNGNGVARKSVALGMPGYGQLTPGAARGFYRCTRTMDLHLNYQESSLLALNMNGLWCWALNILRQGKPLTYFAMQHADIEPEEWWLDKLVQEMEAKELDVLGVVAPIKDTRGVTSIAMARPDGDTWKTHGRLTMSEVCRLPETFTSEDVGYQLLINTGCWVCRFDEAWARKVHFTVNDRICFDEQKGVYFPQVESEDWFLSRLFHELGLKVGVTRKVELGHRGPMVFSNTKAWGTEEFDGAALSASVIAKPDPVEWFPSNVAGWLSKEEGIELARLAEGKRVLEIGAYCGRSTICLAQKALSVGVVDPFDGRETPMPGDTYEKFRSNVRAHGMGEKVTVYKATSKETLPCLPPAFDLVFIDGAHDRASVLADAEMAITILKPGGLLVFHDYHQPNEPEVTEAVDELIRGGARLLSQCDTLAVVRPAEILEPVGTGTEN